MREDIEELNKQNAEYQSLLRLKEEQRLNGDRKLESVMTDLSNQNASHKQIASEYESTKVRNNELEARLQILSEELNKA